jgi:hypothetical protein
VILERKSGTDGEMLGSEWMSDVLFNFGLNNQAVCRPPEEIPKHMLNACRSQRSHTLLIQEVKKFIEKKRTSFSLFSAVLTRPKIFHLDA